MDFHVLPTRTGGAAENMAQDFLLLRRYPAPAAFRFRHYEWRGPAFTFGYAQKIAWVRAQLAGGDRFDLCRRPTGGGIVDHRQDWTYALVIPREHALWEARAAESYRVVHECLAQALRELGQPARVKPDAVAPAGGTAAPASAGVCFQQAERYDVVHERTGEKIAGAAQKRSQQGLLLQGSVWKPAAAGVDWDQFGGRFIAAIVGVAGAALQAVPWPELNEEEVQGLVEHYSAPEWLEYR